MGWGSLIAAAALALGWPCAASAKVACDALGKSCMVEGLAGTCVTDPQGDLSCLALDACAKLTPMAQCTVFDAGAGICTRLETVVCVPIATDKACAGHELASSCVPASLGPGVCLPSGGLLACIDDPDGCAAGVTERRCSMPDGTKGWCRTDEDEPKLHCTTDCGDTGRACLLNGVEATCTQQGGAGFVVCGGGDGSSGSGCCLAQEPTLALHDPTRAPALASIGVLAAALVGRRRRASPSA